MKCPDCNEEIKGNPNFHAKKHQSSVAVAERTGPRSAKFRGRGEGVTLTPMEQIRRIPHSGADDSTGAWCYYIRPGGKTLREVLGLSPNGGVPDTANPKMRGRFGMNSELYQAKLRAKGFIPIGSKLDSRAMKMVVDEMTKNRQEGIWEMQDQIDECDQVIANSDRPDIRDLEKRKKAAAQKRLAMLEQEIDPEELLAELNEIARMQRMANVPASVLQVMREEIGAANAQLLSYFKANKGAGGDSGAEFTGKDFIDAD